MAKPRKPKAVETPSDKHKAWEVFHASYELINSALDRIIDFELTSEEIDAECEFIRKTLRTARVAVHSYIRPDLD